jgi:hypothetical protein
MGMHFGNVSVTIYPDDMPSAAQAPIFTSLDNMASDIA